MLSVHGQLPSVFPLALSLVRFGGFEFLSQIDVVDIELPSDLYINRFVRVQLGVFLIFALGQFSP